MTGERGCAFIVLLPVDGPAEVVVSVHHIAAIHAGPKNRGAILYHAGGLIHVQESPNEILTAMRRPDIVVVPTGDE